MKLRHQAGEEGGNCIVLPGLTLKVIHESQLTQNSQKIIKSYFMVEKR